MKRVLNFQAFYRSKSHLPNSDFIKLVPQPFPLLDHSFILQWKWAVYTKSNSINLSPPSHIPIATPHALSPLWFPTLSQNKVRLSCHDLQRPSLSGSSPAPLTSSSSNSTRSSPPLLRTATPALQAWARVPPMRWPQSKHNLKQVLCPS